MNAPMPNENSSSRLRLEQARRLLALAQTGLHYTTGVFDKERYEEIAAIAHAQIAEIASMKTDKVTELFAFEEGYANPKLDVRCAVFDEAGQILLVHETVDQAKEPRSAWTYNPGQRRVRLAPNVAYDNPGTAADGIPGKTSLAKRLAELESRTPTAV